nr:hypothetical protein [Saprospiraceae bacterium]
MLQIFRVNQLFNSLLLLPYALLLNHRLFFVAQQDYPSGTDGLIAGGFEYFNNQYPLSASLMLILMLFIQALILNRISIIFRIGNEPNLFPGMIYLIFCSFFPAFQYLTGLVVGQFFFLLAVYCLFDTYKRHRDIGNLFNSAFWMSLASMYYTPFFIGFLLILIGGFILKSMKGRDFLLILNGLLVPYFL